MNKKYPALERLTKLSTIVWLGIFMTVISAIITNHFLEKNNQKIANLNNQSLFIDRQIDSKWQLLQEAESKLDLAIVTLSNKSIIKKK